MTRIQSEQRRERTASRFLLQKSGDVAMQKWWRSSTNSLADAVKERDRLMLAAVLRLREEDGRRGNAAPGIVLSGRR